MNALRPKIQNPHEEGPSVCARVHTPKLLMHNTASVRRGEFLCPSGFAGRCKVKHLRDSAALHAHARGEKLINSMIFRLWPSNLLHEPHLSTDLYTGFVDNPEL
jgi:hypothetical protein